MFNKKKIIISFFIIFVVGISSGCMMLQKNSDGSKGSISNIVDTAKERMMVSPEDKQIAKENCIKGATAIFNYDEEAAKKYITPQGTTMVKEYYKIFRKIVHDYKGLDNFTVDVSASEPNVVDNDTINFDITITYPGSVEVIKGISMKRENKTWKLSMDDFIAATQRKS